MWIWIEIWIQLQIGLWTGLLDRNMEMDTVTNRIMDRFIG